MWTEPGCVISRRHGARADHLSSGDADDSRKARVLYACALGIADGASVNRSRDLYAHTNLLCDAANRWPGGTIKRTIEIPCADYETKKRDIERDRTFKVTAREEIKDRPGWCRVTYESV